MSLTDEIASSPVLRRNLRKSLGRKSLSTPGRLTITHSPSFADAPVNDDEAERRQRHRERVLEMQRKSLNSPATPTERRQSLGTGIAGLTNAQLSEHYANCMKLFAENKITVKNAFGLHLIDYMAEVLKNRDGSTNFQVASCTLDASAKIYAYRVDYVHAEAFKVAGGLVIAEDKKTSSGSKDDNVDGQEKKKKRKIKKSNTVEQNVKSLNLNKIEMGFQIDPMFIKLSAAYEEGGINGILFNTLCSDDGCVIPLDSVSTYHDSSSETEQVMVDITFLREINNRIQDDQVRICPEFENFTFSNYDASLDVSACEEHVTPPKRSVLAFDVDAEPEPLEDSFQGGNGNIDDNEVAEDGNCDNRSIHCGETDGQDTIFGESLFLERRDACVPATTSAVKAVTLESVSDLSKVLASRPSEYSYFDNNLLATWAGPNHWKVRPFSKSMVPEQMTLRKKVRKPPMKIDYDVEKDFSNNFMPGKKTIMLNKKTMQLWSKEKITLPHDVHYDPKKVLQLFITFHLFPQLSNTTSEVDPTVGDYNYDNPNDRENFCPSVEGEDCGSPDADCIPGNNVDGTLSISDPSVGGFSQNISEMPLSQGNFIGDNLVQAPVRIAKINIQYARTAKKIDVKRLKQTMWRILVTPSEENKENIDEQQLPQMMDGQVKFSDLYRTLPEKVSSSMKKNLSVPIVFVCFLHIVNEKNLKLLHQEDLSDFLIMQS